MPRRRIAARAMATQPSLLWSFVSAFGVGSLTVCTIGCGQLAVNWAYRKGFKFFYYRAERKEAEAAAATAAAAAAEAAMMSGMSSD